MMHVRKKGVKEMYINHLCHLSLGGGGHGALGSCALLSNYSLSTLHFNVSVCFNLISA